MRRWFADLAYTGRVEERVLIEVRGDRIAAVHPGVTAPPDATRLPGLVIPGLADTHSHAFHRALRGRTHRQRGDFWSWRGLMYEVAARLEPDSYLALARATFAEMVLAGVTAVGEFHYLHHDPRGHPYADEQAMSEAVIAAAAMAGLRLTLIDTCFLRGDFGRPLEGVQIRFADGDPERWARRAEQLRPRPGVLQAAGIHSVRTVDQDGIAVVRDWAAERDAPLHLHLSEQPAENASCRAITGRSPTQLLDGLGVLGPRTTAVHATHVTPSDIALLGTSGTGACLCPTTERDLADGVGPASALRDAGSPLSVGSDSHAVIDLFEESRAIELDERLSTGERGRHRPEALLDAATGGGMAALGWEAGVIAPGRLADLVALDVRSPRLAGADIPGLAAHVVFAASAADVTHVVVGGRLVVADGHHLAVEDVGGALHDAIEEVFRA